MAQNTRSDMGKQSLEVEKLKKENMESGQILTLTIEDLSRGGAGIARMQDQGTSCVVFVPLTMPGDRVEVRLLRFDKSFWIAELVKIVEPSPQRRQPPCEVFGVCGGCQWQHVPYGIQWKTKVSGVQHALKRTGVQLPKDLLLEEFPADEEFSYRNRIQLRMIGDQYGYFKKGSRDLVPIAECPIAVSAINQKLPSLKTQSSRYGKDENGMQKVEIAYDAPTDSVQFAWNQRHGAAGFRQVNDLQNEKLRGFVEKFYRDVAATEKGLPVLDLYGGSGNLTDRLIQPDQSKTPSMTPPTRIDCVDLFPAGKHSDQRFFHASSVLPWLKKNLRSPAFVILDPPREGLGDQQKGIFDSLNRAGCRHLVFVNCDADSFAKDVRRIEKMGWAVQKLGVFDFFPQTPHVEVGAYLTRS